MIIFHGECCNCCESIKIYGTDSPSTLIIAECKMNDYVQIIINVQFQRLRWWCTGKRPPPPHRVIMAWSAGAVDGNTLLKEAQLTENYLTNWLRHDQPASQPSNRPADRVSREEVVRTARRMKVVLDRGGGGGKTLVYYSLLCPFRLDENANQQTGKDHAIRFYSTRLWSCPVQSNNHLSHKFIKKTDLVSNQQIIGLSCDRSLCKELDKAFYLVVWTTFSGGLMFRTLIISHFRGQLYLFA